MFNHSSFIEILLCAKCVLRRKDTRQTEHPPSQKCWSNERSFKCSTQRTTKSERGIFGAPECNTVI